MTLTGVIFGSPFYTRSGPRIAHSATEPTNSTSEPFVLDFTEQPIELAQNEVVAIRTVVNSVVGDGLYGGCEFYGG
jgi:hypothetical protein